MKFICGLRSAKHTRPCGEWFESWAELADHMNLDHKLTVWIAGGLVTQDQLRSDHRKRREIMQWITSAPSQ
jgi:hypothetical protein